MALHKPTYFTADTDTTYTQLGGYTIQETAGSTAVVNFRAASLADPSPALTAANADTAGSVEAGAHLYKWTATTADGETEPSAASNSVLVEVGTQSEIQTLTITNGAPINEVQTLTLTAGAEADTFKLTFNAHESTDAVTIPAGGYANVAAADIKTCLLTISDWTTKTADIAVVKTGNDYAITFSGTLGAQDIGAITVTSKTGAADGSVAETTAGKAAGTFTVTFGGQTTAATAYDATAATLQTNLWALSSIADNDVAVTGAAGGPYTLTWLASLGDVAEITASGTACTATPATTQTGDDGVHNGKVNLSGIPTRATVGSGVTGINIYRTAAGGSTYTKLVTLSADETTYLDNTADGSLSGAIPTTDTTGSTVFSLKFVANETKTVTPGHPILWSSGTVQVEVVSGAVAGTIWGA